MDGAEDDALDMEVVDALFVTVTIRAGVLVVTVADPFRPLVLRLVGL